MSSIHPEGAVQEDPVYRHCRREAIFILSLWVCCFVYTVSYCYLYGYTSHEPDAGSTGPGVATLLGPLESWNRDPASISYPLGLGIPDWVFYGVALPWCLCVVTIVWFALVMFAEDDISAGGEAEEEVTDGDEGAP